MRKRILAMILLISSIFASAALAKADDGTAWIDGKTADRVHLRAEPSLQSASLGLYFSGTTVTCLSDSAQAWTKVRIGSETGYIKSEFLRLDSIVSSRQPTGYVQADAGTSLRTAPNEAADASALLPRGTAVIMLGETSTHWYYVAAFDGTTGYLQREAISSTPVAAAPSPLLAAALRDQQPVYSSDKETTCLFSQAFEDPWLQADRYTSYAVMDIDHDGEHELVLRAADDYGYAVLDVQQDTVYAYGFYIRAMNGLKADGSFAWSNGAMNSGYATLHFENGEAVYDDYTYLDDIDGRLVYVVDHAAATEQAFDRAVQAEDQKPEPAWQPIETLN